jgi:hypothetical protein
MKVCAHQLLVVHFNLCLGCAQAKPKNLEGGGHVLSDHEAECSVILPAFLLQWDVGGVVVGVGVLVAVVACPPLWLSHPSHQGRNFQK